MDSNPLQFKLWNTKGDIKHNVQASVLSIIKVDSDLHYQAPETRR